MGRAPWAGDAGPDGHVPSPAPTRRVSMRVRQAHPTAYLDGTVGQSGRRPRASRAGAADRPAKGAVSQSGGRLISRDSSGRARGGRASPHAAAHTAAAGPPWPLIPKDSVTRGTHSTISSVPGRRRTCYRLDAPPITRQSAFSAPTGAMTPGMLATRSWFDRARLGRGRDEDEGAAAGIDGAGGGRGAGGRGGAGVGVGGGGPAGRGAEHHALGLRAVPGDRGPAGQPVQPGQGA